MTEAVIDASTAVSWLFESQSSSASLALLRRIDEFELLAPFMFDWEVKNVIHRHTRVGEDARALFEALCRQLADFQIELEEPFDVDEVVPIARETELSLFDAAYFQLALQRRLPLISRDTKLLEVAQAYAVEVFDTR